MPRSRFAILTLLLGIIAASVTVGVAWLYFRPDPNAVAPTASQPKVVPMVLTASRDMAVGSLITANDITWAPLRNGTLLSAHMERGKTEESEVLGAVVRRTVYKGVPLTWSAIVRRGDQGFLAAALRPGHRAVTIAVDRATGEAALISPGDHVDVILTAKVKGVSGGGENTLTGTILENIRVVAVNRQVQSAAQTSARQATRNAASTVTLELQPPEAERLILAKSKGSISLAMRSLTDNLPGGNRTPTALEDLLSPPVAAEPVADVPPAPTPAPAERFFPPPPAPALAPPPPPEVRVQIFRGAKREEVTVKNIVADEGLPAGVPPPAASPDGAP